MSDLVLEDLDVMVTGGSGFLGRCIVAELTTRGARSISVPRSADYDLRDPAACERAFQDLAPDVVIHGAAVVGGIGANQEQPGTFFYANMTMGVNVIEACRRHEVTKLVTIGTVCSYPKFTQVPFREESLWDGYPEETNAPYGVAKKALLVQQQAYRQEFGLRSIFLMPTNLYGPADNFDPASSHVIPALIRKFVEARESKAPTVEIWGTGSASREFLYVDDAARGIVMATTSYDDPEPVNLGLGAEITIRDLAALIRDLTGYTGEVIYDPTKPDGQPRRALDGTRAKERFGFEPTTRLADGLRATIDWFESHREQLTP